LIHGRRRLKSAIPAILPSRGHFASEECTPTSIVILTINVSTQSHASETTNSSQLAALWNNLGPPGAISSNLLPPVPLEITFGMLKVLAKGRTQQSVLRNSFQTTRFSRVSWNPPEVYVQLTNQLLQTVGMAPAQSRSNSSALPAGMVSRWFTPHWTQLTFLQAIKRTQPKDLCSDSKSPSQNYRFQP